jgi:hypothetical protein
LTRNTQRQNDLMRPTTAHSAAWMDREGGRCPPQRAREAKSALRDLSGYPHSGNGLMRAYGPLLTRSIGEAKIPLVRLSAARAMARQNAS